MSRLISLAFVTALAWVVALSVTPTAVEATSQHAALTSAVHVDLPPISSRVADFPTTVRLPADASPRIVAVGGETLDWGIDIPDIGIVPLPKPKYVPRDYGPMPALTGPILLDAAQYIGIPYVHGGNSTSGFDCSGFVQTVYRDLGYSIPRTTGGILGAGRVISASEAQPGDILYWPGHVGLYVAPGWRLDANHSGSTVGERPMYGSPTYITFTH